MSGLRDDAPYSSSPAEPWIRRRSVCARLLDAQVRRDVVRDLGPLLRLVASSREGEALLVVQSAALVDDDVLASTEASTVRRRRIALASLPFVAAIVVAMLVVAVHLQSAGGDVGVFVAEGLVLVAIVIFVLGSCCLLMLLCMAPSILTGRVGRRTAKRLLGNISLGRTSRPLAVYRDRIESVDRRTGMPVVRRFVPTDTVRDTGDVLVLFSRSGEPVATIAKPAVVDMALRPIDESAYDLMSRTIRDL